MSNPIQAIQITSDKQTNELTVSKYQDYNDAVEGWIEAVDLLFGVMWVNEEFRLIFGAERFNSIASDLCGLGGRPDLMFGGVLGNVLVTGPTDSSGESTDITDSARRAIERIAREARL